MQGETLARPRVVLILLYVFVAAAFVAFMIESYDANYPLHAVFSGAWFIALSFAALVFVLFFGSLCCEWTEVYDSFQLGGYAKAHYLVSIVMYIAVNTTLMVVIKNQQKYVAMGVCAGAFILSLYVGNVWWRLKAAFGGPVKKLCYIPMRQPVLLDVLLDV